MKKQNVIIRAMRSTKKTIMKLNISKVYHEIKYQNKAFH